jgi:hypothetical protein
MECQLLIAQLAVLLEQGAAQHRLRRQSLLTRSAHPMPGQVRRDQAGQFAVVVEPCGHRLQLTADLVSGEQIEYAGLDRAFLAHCRLGLAPGVLETSSHWTDSTPEKRSPRSFGGSGETEDGGAVGPDDRGAAGCAGPRNATAAKAFLTGRSQ